jgi:hypothetical protein
MKRKLALLAVFGVVNFGFAASSLSAGWTSKSCKDVRDGSVYACCVECSFFCSNC